MDYVQTVVVGAGVVGLAVARELALRGQDVLIIEAADAFGTGVSSRNSEVIHGGLYYPTGSLKARLCVEGRRALTQYLGERQLPHHICGKLIVATEASELPALDRLQRQAVANDVEGLTRLTQSQAQALEPELRVEEALFSPVTGIVDSHALMLSLLGDFERANGLLALHTRLLRAEWRGTEWHLHLQSGSDPQFVLRCSQWVNSAGLSAPALCRLTQGLEPEHHVQTWFCKGHYFRLTGRAPFQHLIYPLHNAAGLGVHVTLDLGGQVRFGPDTDWVDDPEDLDVDGSRALAFAEAIRQYWPGLPQGALQPDYAGIRPKLVGPGQAAADFRIDGPEKHGLPLVNLLGIESPGLTACLALARLTAQRLEGTPAAAAA